jgi:hypothetical protein
VKGLKKTQLKQEPKKGTGWRRRIHSTGDIVLRGQLAMEPKGTKNIPEWTKKTGPSTGPRFMLIKAAVRCIRVARYLLWSEFQQVFLLLKSWGFSINIC